MVHMSGGCGAPPQGVVLITHQLSSCMQYQTRNLDQQSMSKHVWQLVNSS
jgi:hypothetical protein